MNLIEPAIWRVRCLWGTDGKGGFWGDGLPLPGVRPQCAGRRVPSALTERLAVMELTFKTGEFDDAARVRRAIFMEEQGFCDEFDAADGHPDMIHVTAYDESGALVGCARVFPAFWSRISRTSRGAGCSGAWRCFPTVARAVWALRSWLPPRFWRPRPVPPNCNCTPSAAWRPSTSALAMRPGGPSRWTNMWNTSGWERASRNHLLL